MRQRQPRSWIILISAICGLLYLSLQFSPEDLRVPDVAAPERNYPETFMQGVSDVHFGERGQPRYRLGARQINYYTEGDHARSVIERPRITIAAEPGDPPWQIDADRGHSRTNAPHFTLEENVRAWSRHPEHGIFEVQTDEIHFDTERQFAHTEKPVTMQSAHGITTAVGLRAELEAGRIELLSEVKGSYEPQ
ncbi:MAG TPA: LPS export ABC transporter periplasmic protein LptC [Cellvibrionaceae bacterium]